MIAWLLALGVALAAPAEWQLVAAYDLTAVDAIGGSPTPFVWRAPTAMDRSCGPAKSPDGLGVFEAQAVASGLTPTLAIVLEGGPDAPPLGPHNVAVAVGYEDRDQRVRLQPLVSPRQLRVAIGGDEDTQRFQKLVRAQFDIEGCMEHKTGRGWSGGTVHQLKQAFMLVEPSPPTDPSRKYFGGQTDPVPALLGAPAACVDQRAADVDPVDEATGVEDDPEDPRGRGEASLTLVATDVWGARLPDCQDLPDRVDPRRFEATIPPPQLPLVFTLGEGEEPPPPPPLAWSWREVASHVRVGGGTGTVEERARVELRHTVEPPDTSQPAWEYRLDCPLFTPGDPTSGDPPGITDLLARIPYWYPTLEREGRRQVVLLVPNWQIVEALRRVERNSTTGATEADAEKPMLDPGTGVFDGVGHVLTNPSLLYVQVPATGQAAGPFDRWASTDPTDAGTCQVARREVDEADGDWTQVTRQPGADQQWLNLAASMSLGVVRQPIGYTVGALAGREPVVLTRPREAAWDRVLEAQRNHFQAMEIAAAFVLLIAIGSGLFRLSDLWTRSPEERAAYWPGPTRMVVSDPEADAPPDDNAA